MTIICKGKRYSQSNYDNEKDFEDEIVRSSKMLFGKSTIYINAKKKIDSKSLGGTIPDGFLFDFNDPSDPQFYIVEVELSEHNFFNHIFPQITKFFAFFKNHARRKTLVDKLFAVVDTDEAIKNEIKKYLGQTEIYKFISDIIESSQNILLIADGQIVELPEIMDTYTDTWGKMVMYLEIKSYFDDNDIVYTITPDFETLQYEGAEKTEKVDNEAAEFNESYHLEEASDNTKAIYERIKTIALKLDKNLVFNPQKYYISIKADRNIAFLKVRIKKVRFIAMMPEEAIRGCIHHHVVSTLSPMVQKFYNGPCAAVNIVSTEHMNEIEALIQKMIEYNKRGGS